MSPRKTASLVSLVAAVAGAATAPAQAGESGWFSGINAASLVARQIDNGRLSGRGDSGDQGERLSGSLRINRNLNFEMGYADFPKVGSDGSSPIPINPTSSIKAHGWQFLGVGTVPLSERFGLFGRVGAYRGDRELNANFGNGADVTQATYGMGLKYDFTSNFRVQGAWDRYRLGVRPGSGDVQDVDLLTIGLKYKF